MPLAKVWGRPLSFEIGNLYRQDLPPPEKPWSGIPEFSFVGGNNDEANVPVAGLTEAAARVLQREGRRLAIYNLGGSPLATKISGTSYPTNLESGLRRLLNLTRCSLLPAHFKLLI